MGEQKLNQKRRRQQTLSNDCSYLTRQGKVVISHSSTFRLSERKQEI